MPTQSEAERSKQSTEGDFFSSRLRGLCTHEHMERKLTAILSADVHGYSRLMGEDEESTVRTLTAYREVMTALIQQHRGRVVDSPGDNLLAEFVSVVDAVRCAIEIQWELKARNAEMPAHRRMEFRIGINLGDVVVEGERLYGDGVNIAARLESLADPGGTCISGTVYDHIENKLALKYNYLGEQAVKNITKPVRVYRVQTEPGAATPTVREERSERPRPRAFAVVWLPRPFFDIDSRRVDEVRSANDDKTGVGDTQLRTKYHLLDSKGFNLASGLTLRLPTGEEEDFQGIGDVTLTPFLALSQEYGRLDVHASTGIEINCDDSDHSRVRYAGGMTLQVVEQLALIVDVIGSSNLATDRIAIKVPQFVGSATTSSSFIDVTETLSTDIVDLAVGFKVNLYRSVVGFANVFVPLNDDGLRSKVIPAAGLEVSF